MQNYLFGHLGTCSLFADPLYPSSGASGLSFPENSPVFQWWVNAGWWLDAYTDALSLPLLDWTGGENKAIKLASQDKDGEIAYQLPSQAKEACLGEN